MNRDPECGEPSTPTLDLFSQRSTVIEHAVVKVVRRHVLICNKAEPFLAGGGVATVTAGLEVRFSVLSGVFQSK